MLVRRAELERRHDAPWVGSLKEFGQSVDEVVDAQTLTERGVLKWRWVNLVEPVGHAIELGRVYVLPSGGRVCPSTRVGAHAQ
jgi:hypothetical protein